MDYTLDKSQVKLPVTYPQHPQRAHFVIASEIEFPGRQPLNPVTAAKNSQHGRGRLRSCAIAIRNASPLLCRSVVASYCLLCLRNKGPRLSACSNLLQHAPKWRIGSKTHSSIRIQEGQPNLSFCRCDRAADRNAFRSLPTGQRLSQSGTHLTVLPSAAIVTRFDADHSDLRRRERSRGARLLLLGMKRILDAV